MTSAPRCGRFAAGLLVVGCLAGGPASAQAPAPAQVPPSSKRGWSFYVITEGDFESNPNFQRPPNDPSDFSGSGGGGLAYTQGSARGNISLTADARALFYRELTELNTRTFGGTLAGNYRSGPRTDLTFNGSVASDYARRSQFLVAQGIVLGQAQVITTRLGGGVSHVLSSRSSFALSARFEQANFDSDVLRDGKSLGGSAVLNRRVKPTTSLSLTYSFDQTDSEIERRQIHTGAAGARFTMGPRRDVSINLGASSFQADIGERKVAPYAAATFDLKYQYLTLMFGLSHEVRQAYGLGQLRESDLASMALTRSFGARRASFNASMAYSYNRSPSSSSLVDLRYTAYGATAGLKLPMGRNLVVDGGYSYYRSSQADVPIDSHTVSVSLAYRFEPR